MTINNRLRIRNLNAGYGRAEVLHGLDLDADQGTIVTVIGPNGAGKSTMLNVVMGLIPSQGTIEYNGQSIATMTLEERVLLGIALVPEKRELFGTMSVEDNLVLGGYRQVRLRNRNWRDRIDDIYTLFPRLKERRTQAAGTLSGGERQMVALGRALMSRPTLLLLDEPSLGLAPLVVQEIFRTVSELRATGVTILLVEQNARAALDIADSGYVLELGGFSLSGPAKQLGRDPRVIESYLGSAHKSRS